MMTETRVWIYQADRFLTTKESAAISESGKAFIQNWKAHGKPLSATFDVLHQLFLIFRVDQSLVGASGCSIDASVKFVQEIEQEYAIDFFNRKLMAYYNEDKKVHLTDLADLPKLVEKGEVKEDTKVFNNLVDNGFAFQQEWIIPFAESWHKRFADAQ